MASEETRKISICLGRDQKDVQPECSNELPPKPNNYTSENDGDSINLWDEDANVVVDVELGVEELQSILNESVDELIQFLVIIEEVSAEKVDELISFSFNDEDKTRPTKASHDMNGRKLETIIPQMAKRVWLEFGTKSFVMWMCHRSKISSCRVCEVD
ncbi:hypothetical protein J1N35_005448 [Gossypium stocksii]|uniref:Uncharacterized protein n=1 Tax=Gossypium stocksii TaxID=47602 RepID=A0A9D3WFA3_9ROSI|nr:hypothetical protein J1N35_005448 [Gossypium stocksii]